MGILLLGGIHCLLWNPSPASALTAGSALTTRSALSASSAFTSGPAVDTLTLVVTVVEAGSDRPLAGASVTLEGTDRTAIASPRGEVRFTDLAEREYTLLVESFGYTRARTTVTLPRRFPVRVGLASAPLELEGLTAEAAAVLRVEERRRSVPFKVQAIEANDLARELRPLAEVLLADDLGMHPCTGLDGVVEPCFTVFGDRQPITYCLDERRIEGIRWELDDIRPRDLYSVEVFTRENTVIVYLLSHNFVDRRIRDGAPLSWQLPCYEPFPEEG